MMRKYFILFGICLMGLYSKTQTLYHEQYRPQIHFSPKEHWMNDPNGMVYYAGLYHLFFQYYPYATIWGPMHWGHATSRDLVHWKQQPIALYPDSLGYIFSGSAVVDAANTSGLGVNGKPPLVAIFTQHDPIGEKNHTDTYQNESLAYSLDSGRTWHKYGHNPVLPNPGITDFRDPKIFYYETGHKWIMTLAVKDRICFYSSPDLKQWKKESEFAGVNGAHGGVWECPDLFTLDYMGHKVWVLLVNINPGGPNGGSATQYFIGDFDGMTFRESVNETRWLNYGPDEYAGVTWAGTGDQRLFIGWMSNWVYANQVPTSTWRGANTLPQQLGLERVGDALYVTAKPVPAVGKLAGKPVVGGLTGAFGQVSAPARIDLLHANESFALTFSNTRGEKLIVGYDKGKGKYFIDRTHAGRSDFDSHFAAVSEAPRISREDTVRMSIYLDKSSVEVFADGGLTDMTALVFPEKPYTFLSATGGKTGAMRSMKVFHLNGIWDK